jgi:hypothetical protein
MAFDMGFDFRGTAGYVTDPAYGVPVLGEAYPHTYTNGNGNSINAGWAVSTSLNLDRTSTNDARIAGANGEGNGTPREFNVNLSSGSAPGAGTYTNDIAVGDSLASVRADFKVLDDTTVLIDGTNGGAGFGTAANDYIDASLAVVTATTTWTGATVSKTFATTTAKVQIAMDVIASYTFLAHFRLTLAPTPPVSTSNPAVGGAEEDWRLPRLPKWAYLHRGYLRYEKEATHWYNPETEEIEKLYDAVMATGSPSR